MHIGRTEMPPSPRNKPPEEKLDLQLVHEGEPLQVAELQLLCHLFFARQCHLETLVFSMAFSMNSFDFTILLRLSADPKTSSRA